MIEFTIKCGSLANAFVTVISHLLDLLDAGRAPIEACLKNDTYPFTRMFICKFISSIFHGNLLQTVNYAQLPIFSGYRLQVPLTLVFWIKNRENSVLTKMSAKSAAHMLHFKFHDFCRKLS